MPSKTEAQIIAKILNVIRLRKRINEWDLVDACNLSIAQYTKLRPYLRHRYEGTEYEYDPVMKRWEFKEELVDKQQPPQ